MTVAGTTLGGILGGDSQPNFRKDFRRGARPGAADRASGGEGAAVIRGIPRCSRAGPNPDASRPTA